MAEKEKTKRDEVQQESQNPSAAGKTRLTEISESSISALGRKLDEFGKNLSEDDQVTLATVFALAARGFTTFTGPVSCARDLRIGVGRESISVEQISGGSIPKLSEMFADAFCPGKVGRFSIEGLEVEKTMIGTKSVAAANPSAAAGTKSVAASAFCRNPGMMASKSVAASAFCRNPGMMASKSVAASAFCRNPGMMASKSVAASAFCRNPGMMASKSVAASAFCRNPGMTASKSVAASAFCRNPGMMASKSVAASAFCRNPGMMASKASPLRPSAGTPE